MPKPSRPLRLRSRPPGADSLAVTTLLCAAGSLAAQNAAPKPAAEPARPNAQTDLEEVVVEGRVYNPKRLQSPKYTEPVRDIPATLTIIPRQVIEDRGAFTLRDVLKNTPGISMQAGEGVSTGGATDGLSIRGFSSRSDWFLDGIRDYGNYNRDPWNMDQVEVAKGPASTTMGRGSTGGYINTVSKMAGLGDSVLTTATVGTNNLYRGTLDVNEQLSAHSALRVNGMYNSNDVAGRDNVFQGRYGIASSLVFGIGTDTRFTLNYMRQEENNMADFGIPYVANGTYSGAGVNLGPLVNQIPPVDYSTFYGRRNYDFQKIQTDIVTAIFEHDFSKTLRFRNTTRWARNHYDARVTAPRFLDTNPGLAGNQYNTTIVAEEQRQRKTNSILSNQSLLNADFDTGKLKHALVFGLEFSYEQQLSALRAGDTVATQLYDPSNVVPLSSVAAAYTPGTPAPGNTLANRTNTILGVGPSDLPPSAEVHLSTISVYLMDTLKLGRHWMASLGIRYDHIHSVQHGFYYTGDNTIFGGSNPGPSNNDDVFTWKGAITYKPVDRGSIYFGYATSFNPTIDGGNAGQLGLTTNGVAVPGGSGGNTSFQGLNAEISNSYELGTKWDVVHERLSLSAALFRTEKINARTTSANVTTSSGDLTVDGVEFGVAGALTKKWQVFAGGTHMASFVRNSSNPAEIGNSLPNAPDYTFNLWTTYNVTDKFQVGGGTQYVGKVIGSSSNPTRMVSDYWTTDVMLSYRFTNSFSMRLNIYNIADNRYIESVSSVGSATPGPGRSAALTASIRF
ncbi:TonB-dependent receptor [Prosthecobacter sp.]|uniref:TonB-dependent receptor n=1 Tax=Prosthecobacter sp. TaxID=1965333 RepID=UPI003783901F